MDTAFTQKVHMVITTFHDVFGLCSVAVVLQALATCVSMMLFSGVDTPHRRRLILVRFTKQIDLLITRQERGK